MRGSDEAAGRAARAEAALERGEALSRAKSPTEAARCYSHAVELLNGVESEDSRSLLGRARVLHGIALLRAGAMADASLVFDELIASADVAGNAGHERTRIAVVRVLIRETEAALKSGANELASASAEVLLRRRTAEPPRGWLDVDAKALFVCAAAFSAAGRTGDGIRLFDELDHRYGGSDDLTVRRVVIEGLSTRAWLFMRSAKPEEAVELYDEALRRIGQDYDPEIHDLRVSALRGKAVALLSAGRYRDAIAVEDEAIRLFSVEPSLRYPYAVLKALSRKGLLLSRDARPSEALKVYEQLVDAYGDDPALIAQREVASALLNTESLLVGASRYEDAVAVADELIEKYSQVTEAAVLERVGEAMNEKALALARLGRLADAVAVDEDIVERFASAPGSAAERIVTRALGHKAFGLRQMGRLDDAITALGVVVHRAGTTPDAQAIIEDARIERAELLLLTGRSEEAAELGQTVIDHAPDVDAGVVARGLGIRGAALVRLARHEEAIATLDRLITQFRDATDALLRNQVAQALNNKHAALRALGRDEDASDTADDLLTNFAQEALDGLTTYAAQCETVDSQAAREQLAETLYARAGLLRALGREQEALDAIRDITTRFQADDLAATQSIIAAANRMYREITDDTDI